MPSEFSAVALAGAAKTDVIGARTDGDLADADPLLARLLACWERLGPDERQALLEAAERLAGDMTPGEAIFWCRAAGNHTR